MVISEKKENKTIVVTGAGGFLGKNLLPVLIEHGHSVMAISSKEKDELGVDGLSAVIKTRDFDSISTAFEKADVLVNCAFPRNVDGVDLAKGMDYLQSIFSIAGKSKLKAIVNISSQSVYSQSRTEPAREDTPVCLESTYAVAKYAAEQLLEAYCADVPHTNIRLASLIGPGFDQRVVNKMVKKALAGEDIVVQENGSRFGYLDVRDAVSALLAVCESNPSTWKCVYNLGPDGGVTLTEIADCVAQLANFTQKTQVHIYSKSSRQKKLLSELDCSVFRNFFNWRPSFSFQETVDHIFAFHDNLLHE